MVRVVLLPGQAVSLISRAGLSPATPTRFEVLTRLPDIKGASRYRIRNSQHEHERVELGSNLVAA
jgi:hypothetical protein